MCTGDYHTVAVTLEGHVYTWGVAVGAKEARDAEKWAEEMRARQARQERWGRRGHREHREHTGHRRGTNRGEGGSGRGAFVVQS